MNGYCSYLCWINALPTCQCGKVTPMKPEFVRNPYNYDSDQLSHDTGLECKDPTLTQQQFIEEADINYIANRFLRTGELPQVPNLPTPGDFEGIFDFQTAMNTIAHAKQEFMKLPAKIRSRFDNDPAKILDFLNDEENRKEAEILGLVNPRQETTNGPDASKAPDGNPQTQTGTAGTAQGGNGTQTTQST